MASKNGVTIVVSGEDNTGAVFDAVKAHLAEVRTNVAQAEKSFNSFGVTGRAAGEEAAQGFISTRASIGLLDNSIRGAHAQAMADLIRLFAQSRIVMAALPLAATAGGLLLLGGIIVGIAEKIHEWRDEQAELADDFTKFRTTAQEALNGVNEKLLEAGIRTDELRKDHLDELRKQLQLIDMQSMNELVQSLGKVATAADAVFAKLKGSWYTPGIGSAGAENALQHFQVQYASLLAQFKDKDASNLLAGTLAQAEHVLAIQKEAQANSGTLLHAPGPNADTGAALRSIVELKKYGVSFTGKEVEAQQALVEALKAQLGIEQSIHELTNVDKGNATLQEHNGDEKSIEDANKSKEEFVAKMRAHQMQAYKDSQEQNQREVEEMNRQSSALGKFVDEGANKKSEGASKELNAQLDVLRAEQEARIRAAEEQMQLAERTANFEVQMGRMSADQRVAYLRDAINREASIKSDASQKLAGIDAAHSDPARAQEDLNAIKAAQQRHDDEMQELAMQDALRRKQIADGLLHSILDPLMQKPKSVSDAFKKMADNISSDLERIAEHNVISGLESKMGGGTPSGHTGFKGMGGLGSIFGSLFGNKGKSGKASNGGLATGAGTIADGTVSALQQGRGAGSNGGVVVNIITQGTPQQAQSSGSTGGGLEQQIISIVLKDADSLGPMSKAIGGAIGQMGQNA